MTHVWKVPCPSWIPEVAHVHIYIEAGDALSAASKVYALLAPVGNSFPNRLPVLDPNEFSQEDKQQSQTVDIGTRQLSLKDMLSDISMAGTWLSCSSVHQPLMPLEQCRTDKCLRHLQAIQKEAKRVSDILEQVGGNYEAFEAAFAETAIDR